MYKKTIIFDLDNTIFPVASIGEKLYAALLKLIENDGRYTGDFNLIKTKIFRKPFQDVAREHNFAEELTRKGLEIQTDLSYDETIYTFPNFDVVRALPQTKFLVTAGFTKVQNSKIDQLGVRDLFTEIFILDRTKTDMRKKECFEQILSKYALDKKDVLIVGDDVNSEIQAGIDLGIDTLVYDFMKQMDKNSAHNLIRDYSQINSYL